MRKRLSFGNRFLFIEICSVRSHSYINSATTIINQYDGNIPFAAWIKNYFKEHKKFGSKDRKIVTHLCYCFFRLGNAFQNKSLEERLIIGQLLCSETTNIVVEEQKPEWKEFVHLPVEEKLEKLDAPDEWQHIFSFNNYLSDEIDKKEFAQSFLIQPDLFLRIRPKQKEIVLKKLDEAAIVYSLEEDNCIRLANNTKVEDILIIDKEAVVQDLNSQKVLSAFELQTINSQSQTSIWDCCAASGGKSILAYDLLKDIQLTVSDIRESILINLKKRFERAGIKNYRSFVADLSASNLKFQISDFDLIICDAPCSGSGTWGRTPEQLHFFKEEQIEHYTSLQKKIALNASKHIKQNGYLLYITCSVFKKENEEVVSFLQNNSSLQLISADYYKGYNRKADTLFAALFKA
jgi:16S rRNA (cytosine967-C5)-methyltransferase